MTTDGDRQGLIKSKAAAAHLQTTESNLARLRFEGKGPNFIRLGRSIRYRYLDLERWIEANVISGDA